MASLIKDQSKLSPYRDRRFPGTQEEFEHALLTSTTIYIGNMSFYTTEEQVYELFSRAGEIKKIIMGLDKNTKTPCGFCFVLPSVPSPATAIPATPTAVFPVATVPATATAVSPAVESNYALIRYYSREDAEDSVKYISGTILDDRPIRVDFDWGFQEGRQWGRGRSGGQVRDEYRTDYDPDILLKGGYGKLVQRELEAQRQLVDYGTGSLGSFPPVMPSHYGRQSGNHGGFHRHGRDYHRKRYREDDRHGTEISKRNSDHESRRNPNPDSRPEKNPRFRESGDSDDDEEDDRKRRH
ncbi:hypothetical protein TEA_007486 [Camellia sinensis var. sinensis]|uniref:Nuclear cap-binding protein subunit 2 n=1 Tax=Camellia sinensis var. sinensis TaxID=542762 RepID=A0A4S4EV48_CAMSN|nr:hypothetical protein TEA_007486 [Camellia sinensis var. sinensis]